MYSYRGAIARCKTKVKVIIDMRDIERRLNEVSLLTMSEKKGRVNRRRGCSHGVGSMLWRPIIKNDK